MTAGPSRYTCSMKSHATMLSTTPTVKRVDSQMAETSHAVSVLLKPAGRAASCCSSDTRAQPLTLFAAMALKRP